MRRPPLRLVTAGPGGLGQSSAGTRTGCLRWLDAGATTGGGSRPGPRLAAVCAPRKHGAGDRKAAAERRTATRLASSRVARPAPGPAKGRRREQTWQRRAALHPPRMCCEGTFKDPARRPARGKCTNLPPPSAEEMERDWPEARAKIHTALKEHLAVHGEGRT